MPQFLKNLLNKIKEWWAKFTTRQKVLLISLAAIVVIALIVLAVVLNRPNMVVLVHAESPKQAGEIKTLLDGDNGVAYEMSQDGLVFYVEDKDFANATILLASNSIPTEGYSIDNVFEGGFSTTEADKTKKYQLYLENKFAETLEVIENVSDAKVTLSIPEDDGTLIAREEPTYASVLLTLKDEMSEEQAAGIAQFIATEVGDKTTENILILDSDGNVLFSGTDSRSTAGLASSQLTLRSKLEQSVKNQVRQVLLGTDLYDNVEVGLNLSISFDNREVVDHHYYVDEGQSQGYLDSESLYESETRGGNAGVPGTDTNDDTTYVIQDNEYTEATISDMTKKYLPSERITTTTGVGGDLDRENSSLSAVATRYVVYNEDTLKANGTRDDMTFDEFVEQNNERIRTDVDEEFLTLVSNATGIPVNNISLMAYDVPFFQYSSNEGRSLTDWLQIALAILIFAMLGFVVFRSTRKEKEPEPEPELSVENLLEATKEAEEEPLEDIGFQEKSEVRIMIEKFVDENPEATAALLRNWLNEDWG